MLEKVESGNCQWHLSQLDLHLYIGHCKWWLVYLIVHTRRSFSVTGLSLRTLAHTHLHTHTLTHRCPAVVVMCN